MKPPSCACSPGPGLDGAVVMTFDGARAGTTAQDFINHDLIGRLGISGIAVGYDFHFGKGRAGSPSLLASEAPRLGIEVHIQAHVDILDRPVSSSAIRMALAEGQVTEATAMLGAPWFISGEVIHGEKRGRDMGYPTANIRLDKNWRPQAWHLCGAGRDRRQTLRRCCFLRPPPDLRQRRTAAGNLPVRFQWRPLRPEARYWRSSASSGDELKFDGIDALVHQMNDDSTKARAALAVAPDAFPKLGIVTN